MTLTLIILPVLIAVIWLFAKKFVEPKKKDVLFNISEEEIINDIPTLPSVKMSAKPKAKKVKAEVSVEVQPKPKRKYNKKKKDD